MNDTSGFPFALDPAAVLETMRSRYGWGETEVGRAMAALLPAAFAGLKHNTATPDAFRDFMAAVGGRAETAGGDRQPPLAFFFGPQNVQRAVADHVAAMTGLQRDAIAALMPVAATLAMGNVARSFVHGPARDLLDAFLAGYARGRPKPVPNPAAMMASYSEAIQSFWSGFLGAPQGRKAEAPTPRTREEGKDRTGEPAAAKAATARPPGRARADEATPPAEAAPAVETPLPSERDFSTLLDDWMAAGRSLQTSQWKTFEALFDRAGDPPRPTDAD
ncbi:DUF937 domain-containing protein [Polymorphum gilvum]|uniref:DUF937 domain-containing protein n=1 Tax=Polymorphum gilvum (strain LMG 25793 / CGMCC 1.9160 / SL003B-26A1) TaxID=991905 RepID=F2J0W5_POLGS|nr:DUF937 domain-containing protein [Polymorphum gilvum]ADZ71911.1 hypothetical protein SL003B_3489 [Polymorphum gilvum SL003B-26A1]